jgi:hypothetical protein
MKINMKNTNIVWFMAVVLTFSPLIAASQEESIPEPAVESISESAVSQEQAEVAAPEVVQIVEVVEEVGSESPQEGDSTQETIASDLLEEAANPQVQEKVLEEEVVVEEASDLSLEEAIEIIDSATEEEVAELPAAELEPRKEYTFAIEGGGIATKENPEWNIDLGIGEEDTAAAITDVPTLSASQSDVLEVSGECTDPYFVILLYKNQEDYDQNPSSYIFNKAFRCVDGSYSYSLSELPFNLQSGTFYLLVAGQGERGSWKPITALIPIGIEVRTVYPEETEPETQ